jgi:hypothetical protein
MDRIIGIPCSVRVGRPASMLPLEGRRLEACCNVADHGLGHEDGYR